MRPQERVGQRFGRWTIVEPAGTVSNCLHFLCRCDCGAERVVASSGLYGGKTTGCMACHIARKRAGLLCRAEKVSGGRVVVDDPYAIEIEYPCPDCGHTIVSGFSPGMVVWLNNRGLYPRCRACKSERMSAAKAGKPWKYPVSITVMGKMMGLTRQRVHQLVVRDGFDATLAEAKRRAKARGCM